MYICILNKQPIPILVYSRAVFSFVLFSLPISHPYCNAFFSNHTAFTRYSRPFMAIPSPSVSDPMLRSRIAVSLYNSLQEMLLQPTVAGAPGAPPDQFGAIKPWGCWCHQLSGILTANHVYGAWRKWGVWIKNALKRCFKVDLQKDFYY